MKNLNSIVFIVIMLVMSACSDDFVDITPKSQDTASGFLDSEQDVELAVIGLYSSLQHKDIYGQNIAYFTEHYSDNATVRDGGRAGSRYLEFVNFNVSENNLVLNPMWDACYNSIQRANLILNRIGDVSMDESLKQKRIGEVKFIRAMIYFDMVRIWGGVPLIIEEIVSPTEQFGVGRNTSEEVYAQIIQDLNDADNAGLPNKDSSGRVSDSAVRALLGKVYLTKQDWSTAASKLQSIVSDNSYQLLSSFADVFVITNKNNAESIFEIQYTDVEGQGSNFHRNFGPVIGDNAATNNLVQAFDGDPRFDVSFYEEDGFTYSSKYFDNAGSGVSARNLIVIRYADVLLMLAEALNEQGFNTGDAFTYLNSIRTRAGLEALTTDDLLNQSSFREEVRKQRRLELAQENNRWFDLVRWGIAVETIENAKGITIQNHQLLFPIPDEVITENPVLEQNPDYF